MDHLEMLEMYTYSTDTDFIYTLDSQAPEGRLTMVV